MAEFFYLAYRQRFTFRHDFRNENPCHGSVKEPTTQIRVPLDIAEWVKYPGMYEHIRQMIRAYPRHH